MTVVQGFGTSPTGCPAITHRSVIVERVVVKTVPVDEDRPRVELQIDGETYDLTLVGAQALGQILNRAGGTVDGDLG